MRVTMAVSGDPVLDDVTVVTLRDGRLGFATVLARVDRLQYSPAVRLADETHGTGSVTGTARIVRSGQAFEEVCGRTRAATGRLARLRRVRYDAVVLVVPVEPGVEQAQAKSD